MNKYIVAGLICLACLMVGCVSPDFWSKYQKNISGTAVSGAVWTPFPTGKEEAAATHSAVTGSGIHSANNVTGEMQSAEFWIGKTMAADKILMSQEDIQEFNKKMMEQLSTNAETEYYNLMAYNGDLDGETLKKMITRTDFSKETYYRGNEVVTENQWESYAGNCNLDSLADLNTLQYGVVCSRADVRELPTADVLTTEKGNSMTDMLQNTALAVNEPVLIAHRSLDKKYLYVLAEEYAGWVEVEKIGLASSREEWVKAGEMKDFLVVTGDKVYLEPNPVNALVNRMELTMGTRVAIASREEYGALVDGRTVYDNYVVKVPVRREDGSLSYEIATVPVGKAVHRGYLEYTRANVLRQSFSLLGNYYGWGGSFGSRDCSSMVRDIYACFGFRLPRDSDAQAAVPASGRMDLSELSDKEKRQKLNSLEAGAILQMSGHVMIYLGCVEQRYYVISANGQFVDVGEESEGQNVSTRAVTVNDLEVKSPSDGKTWLERLLTAVSIS